MENVSNLRAHFAAHVLWQCRCSCVSRGNMRGCSKTKSHKPQLPKPVLGTQPGTRSRICFALPTCESGGCVCVCPARTGGSGFVAWAHGRTSVRSGRGSTLQGILRACGLQTATAKRKYILKPGLHVTVYALFPFCIPASQTA